MAARRAKKAPRTIDDPVAQRDREMATRVRNLIAHDAANVLRRLEQRETEMVSLFSRLRDRQPMLQTIHSWFPTATFSELARLTVVEQAAVNVFYEELSQLRWYCQYTEDMPSTAHATIHSLIGRLDTAHRALTQVLGSPLTGTVQVVEVEVVERPTPPRPALPAPGRK